MLKLRTKTEFTVPTERGTTTAIVRLIIDKLEIDINNVIPRGYYYFFDAENVFHKLDDISSNPILWSDIDLIDDSFADLVSSTDIKADLMQRLTELTFAKLSMEAGTNYGTSASDYEIDSE